MQDAVAGYVDELDQLRSTLENRYEDVKSGRVQPVDGAEAFRKLREISAHRENI